MMVQNKQGKRRHINSTARPTWFHGTTDILVEKWHMLILYAAMRLPFLAQRVLGGWCGRGAGEGRGRAP